MLEDAYLLQQKHTLYDLTSRVWGECCVCNNTDLTPTLRGKEVVSDRPLAQLEHIKSSTSRKYNNEEVMLKIFVERTVAIRNNTIIE